MTKSESQSVAGNSPTGHVDATGDLALARLVQELTDRIRRGEPVVLESLLGQYPQYAGQLRDLFPTVQALAEIDLTADRSRQRSGDGEGPALGGAIGEYQIVREVGRGGMGIVYEARQLSLNRRVALKVLPFAAALEPRTLARFQQEALAVAQLDHPHIVPVYGVGADRGVHYYAMRYIEGQSLAQIIAGMREEEVEGIEESTSDDDPASRGRESADGSDGALSSQSREPVQTAPSVFPAFVRGERSGRTHTLESGSSSSGTTIRGLGLSTDRAVNRPDYFRGVARLGIQAAEALDYAHEHGVLHRDVKPANLLVDGEGNAWIADFGLARIDAAESLTLTGDFMGTLRYMSPEQALGQRGLVDQRTDVYSLGATLYEILTIRPAFSADNRGELLRQIGHDDPVAPRRIDSAVPGELETVVLKCLEKDPADRYATARDLADDLRCYLDHRPIAARPPRVVERLRKWSRRHQAFVLSAIAALAVSTIFLAASTAWVLHERDAARDAERQTGVQAQLARTALEHEREQRQLADTARTEAQAAAALARTEQLTARQTAEFVVNLFRSGDPIGLEGTGFRTRDENVKGTSIADLLGRAAERVRRELADQPQTQATLLDTLGDVYRSLGMYDRAEPLLVDALDLRKRHLPEGDSRIGESLHHLGWLNYDAGDYQAAERNYLEGLDYFKKWPPADLRVTLRLQMNYAWLLSETIRSEEALPIFREVLAACAGKGKEFALEVTAAQAGVVSTLYMQGHEDQAQLTTLQQLAQHNQLLIARVIVMLKQKDEYRKASNFDAAVAIQNELLKLVRAELGVEHPAYALLLGETAGLYKGKGDLRAAEKAMRESMALGSRSLGEHPRVWEAVTEFATDLVRRGDFAEAEELYHRCQRIVSRRFPPTDWRLLDYSAILLGRLGELHCRSGEYGTAEIEHRDAVRIRQHETTPQVAGDFLTLALQKRVLAQVLYETGRFDEAREMLHDAIRLIEHGGPTRINDAGPCRLLLIALARDTGNYDRAQDEAALVRALSGHFRFGLIHGTAFTNLMAHEFSQALADEIDAVDLLQNDADEKRRAGRYVGQFVADNLRDLGHLLAARGRFAEAEAPLRELLAFRCQGMEEDEIDCITAMLALAGTLARKGELEEARQLSRTGLALFERRYGKDHAWYPAALSESAAILQATRDLAEAHGLLTTALEIRERKLPIAHPLFSQNVAAAAAVRQELGEHQSAADLLRGFLDRLQKVLSDRSWRIAELEYLLAVSLIELGDLSAAETLLWHALAIQDADSSNRPGASDATRRQLIRLYEIWGKPDDAARVREEMIPRQAPPVIEAPRR